MFVGHKENEWPVTDTQPSVDQLCVIKHIEKVLYDKLYKWSNDSFSEHAGKIYFIMNARPVAYNNGVVYDIIFTDTLDYVTTGILYRTTDSYRFIENIKNKAILSF